jgi:glycosyltransferase involved in cell wall biosynthesis
MTQPRISFVVIGLDEAARLPGCLHALARQGFAREQIEVLYVDSGSRDGSPELAAAEGADRVLAIPRAGANAARARNAGLGEARAPFVHFVDGDTCLEPGWAREALDCLESDPRLAAVEGCLREERPDANLYHAVWELDWPSRAGAIDFVGGNALYRAEAVRAVAGFDPAMRVGEEPELGARLRARGWRFRRLDRLMARHDLELESLGDYLRQAYKSGLSCGLVAAATGGWRRGYWSGRLRRTLLQAALLLAPAALAVALLPWSRIAALGCAAVGLLGLLLLALRKALAVRERAASGALALAFGLHTYAVKLPAAAGILGSRRARRSAGRERGDPATG